MNSSPNPSPSPIDPSSLGQLTPVGPRPVDPSKITGLKPVAPAQPQKQQEVNPQQVTGLEQQPQNPAGFRKWLTDGGIYGQNPGVNVVQDWNTQWTKFGGGGIRPQFRAVVQQLVNQGNKLGVYDFDKGHHYAPNDPHLDGRAMDVDTVNGEPVGVRLSQNLGTFINQALQSDPRVRIGVPQQIYSQLGKVTGNGRIFVDAPAHIHVELDPGAQNLGKVPGTATPTNGAINPSQVQGLQRATAANAPAKPQPGMQFTEAGVASAIQAAGQHVEDTGKHFFEEMHYEMGHPLEAYTDVEGVLQRAVGGYLSQTDPTGKAVTTPPTLKAVGMAIYDAFHPHSQEVYNRDTSAQIRSLFAPLGVKPADEGTWAHFGQMITATSAYDPVTYFQFWNPVYDSLKAAGTISRMAPAVKDIPEVAAILAKKQQVIGKLANTAVGKLVHNLFGVRPELADRLEPHAFDARIMIEHGANAEMEPLRQADEELLAQHEQALKGLKPDANGEFHLPEEVQQRYLREPFVFGTPEMRQQAIALGYKPTEAELAKQPLNLLHYNLRDDYQTLIKPPGESLNDATLRVSGGDYKKTHAGFERNRSGEDALGDNQYDITANRLRLGRNVARARMVDNRTQQYLDQYGGWKGVGPRDVTTLSNQAWQIRTGVGDWFKKLGTESIKAFPLPHGLGNVGQLAWNKGGWTAAGLGIKHAITGLSEAQTDRLKALGLWAEYLGRDLNSPWRKPPLSFLGGKGIDKAIDYSTQVLNRLEGGFRQSLLDLADHQHGYDPKNMQNEYKKAKDVLDAIGDYQNLSKVTAVLSGVLGAPFVAFGTSVVPKAVWKALREYPGRIGGAARAQEGLQADKGGPLPPGIKLGGGPVEEFGRMVTDPIGFMESPSRLGPLGIPVQAAERVRHGEPVDPAQLGGQTLQEYGGVAGNVASGLFGLAYPQPGMQRGQLDLRSALLDWLTGRFLGPERSSKSEHYFDVEEETGKAPHYFKRPRFRQ